MRARVLGLVAASCSFLSFHSNIKALTLDEFLGDGIATSTTVGVPVTALTVNSGAVGGRRNLRAEKLSAGSGFTRIETFADPEFSGDTDYSLGYTQGAHAGRGIVTWDGDNSDSLDADGLGALDLTQDGGDTLQLGVKFFDYPSSQALDLTIRLYDSGDPTGDRYSDVIVTLDQYMSLLSPFLLEIPFASFNSVGASQVPGPGGSVFQALSTFGPNGPADLASIGAIRLLINNLGVATGIDLTLDVFKTNGRCISVPNSAGKVIDECGVCLEDPNANMGRDACGICLSGPPGYDYQQHKVFDECGLCPIDPNYTRAKDPCGVCFGDGTSCADCTGTPYGVATFDVCGVCAGNGTTCLDCLGVPFGTAGLDACGVCGGKATDPSTCGRRPDCTIVQATKEVLQYERQLIKNARTVYKKFLDEERRSKRNQCKIDTIPAKTKVKSALETVTVKGREIFTKGVEVCGDSCVTVSYSEEVTALSPQFRTLEIETKRLAKAVQRCYQRLKIRRDGPGQRGVALTIKDVRSGVNELVEKCREQEVCR